LGLQTSDDDIEGVDDHIRDGSADCTSSCIS
jgi:hypothetical protein